MSYVGDARLHDAEITSVQVLERGDITVTVRTYERAELVATFANVKRVQQTHPVGMRLYGLAEMHTDGEIRHFVFVNWHEEDEDDSALHIWADQVSFVPR